MPKTVLLAERLGLGLLDRGATATRVMYSLSLSMPTTRGVMNPVFAGSGSGTGVTTKCVGVGIAWIRIFAGIGSTSVFGSCTGVKSTAGVGSSTGFRSNDQILDLIPKILG